MPNHRRGEDADACVLRTASSKRAAGPKKDARKDAKGRSQSQAPQIKLVARHEEHPTRHEEMQIELKENSRIMKEEIEAKKVAQHPGTDDKKKCKQAMDTNNIPLPKKKEPVGTHKKKKEDTKEEKDTKKKKKKKKKGPTFLQDMFDMLDTCASQEADMRKLHEAKKEEATTLQRELNYLEQKANETDTLMSSKKIELANKQGSLGRSEMALESCKMELEKFKRNLAKGQAEEEHRRSSSSEERSSPEPAASSHENHRKPPAQVKKAEYSSSSSSSSCHTK